MLSQVNLQTFFGDSFDEHYLMMIETILLKEYFIRPVCQIACLACHVN